MDRALISVIIPSYNSGKFLAEAIESVVNQTFGDIEIIVVNDGSTDDTERIVREWQQRDRRIKYINHQINKGLAAARNTGIRAAKGQYIALLDADDVWLPQKLEVQLKLLEEGSEFVYSDRFYLIDDKRTNQSYFVSQDITPCQGKGRACLPALIKKSFLSSSTVIMDRKIIEQIGFYDKSLSASEDYDFWIRILYHDFKINFSFQPLIYQRYHRGQMRNDIFKMRLSRYIVFKKHPELLRICPALYIKKISKLFLYCWLVKLFPPIREIKNDREYFYLLKKLNEYE
jgi:glycosyltransferase involved in cell wall biosynthesis